LTVGRLLKYPRARYKASDPRKWGSSLKKGLTNAQKETAKETSSTCNASYREYRKTPEGSQGYDTALGEGQERSPKDAI
jgi:hypothetical protein